MPNVLATAFVSVKMLSGGIAKDLTRDLEAGGAAAKGAGDKAGKSWAQGFQSSGVTKASAGIVVALGAAAVASVKAAADFQASMTRISTQAGVAKSQLGSLSAGVLKLAGQVGEDPDSLAESLYHVESNFSSLGITGPKALSLVKVAAEGARVGGADLVDVTNAIGAAVASGIPGVQNFQQAMGVLNATVGAGDMKMQDLADAFGTGVLASVKGYGLSIKDVGAALAVFGDNNIRGAKAGTDLRVAVQALAVPAAAGADELKKLGLNSQSFADTMSKGGLLPAVELLDTRLDKAGVTGAKAGEAITEIFGKKAGTGIAILAGQLDRFQSKYPALTKGAADFGAAWKQTAATPAQQFKELEASADALGISLGTKLMPYVMELVSWLQRNQDAVEKGAIGVAAFAVAITGLSLAIKTVTTISTVARGIASFVSGVAGGVGAIGRFASAATAAATAQKALAAATAEGGLADGAFVVAADGETTSIVALSAAEKAAAISGAALAAINPVVWAVGAAAAVAALGVLLVKNSNQTQDLIDKYSDQDKATGFNISGYQKLAAQLGTVNDGQSRLSQTVRLSQGPVDLARDGAAAYSVALGEVTTSQTGAQRMAANLKSGLASVAGSYGITTGQAEALAVAAGVSATQFAASGSEGTKAQQKVFAYGNAAGQAAIQADQLADANNGVVTSMDTLASQLLASQGDVTGFKQAQQQAVIALAASSTGLNGNSAAALAAQNAVNQATFATEQLVKQEEGMPGGMAKASATLLDQIRWLKAHGDNSAYARAEIKALQDQFNAMKPPKPMTIVVHGDGTYSVAGAGVGHGLQQGSVPGQGAARGLMVTGGTPGKDSVPIMAMPGELVVPTHLVKSGAADSLRGKIPGFAAGGIVPAYSGAPDAAMGQWAQSNINATATLIEQAVATSAAAAIKAAMAKATATFGATPGGGAPAANARLAQSLMPSWASGSEWAAWNAVAMRESGWNQFARNPNGGAYGIPQALPGSKMGAAANPPQSNPGAQIKWMIGYIQGRYKDPIGAWAHEQSSGWYAKGTPGSGAAPGWGVVGEQGKELVHFAGGEHVLPASMTSKILTGKMDLPGYATGTKPPTPAQKLKAARLKELEADVGKADKLTAARNKAITTRTLQIDAQLLADLQHPKDKNGPKKVAAMRKALSSYEATSGKPINVLHQEISLLRALTGNPAGAVYGGPAPAKATTDTSSTDDSSTDDTSTDSAASAASAAVSAAQSAAAIAQWAQGIAPSVNPSSSIAVGGGGTVGGTGGGGGLGIQAGGSYQFGGSGPAVSGTGGDIGGVIIALRQEMASLRATVRATPGQNTAGMRAALSGTVTGARQGGRYRTR